MAKILVVEDISSIADMLVERLGRRGHAVLLAGDSDTAFSSAKASQPDVILLELQLRGEADWATARALKYDEMTHDIPIIALMGNSSEEARALALQNGCDELHGKPVDFGRLLQQIGAAVEVARPQAGPDDEVSVSA